MNKLFNLFKKITSLLGPKISSIFDTIKSWPTKTKIIISSSSAIIITFIVLLLVPATHNAILRTILPTDTYYSYIMKSNLKVLNKEVNSKYNTYIDCYSNINADPSKYEIEFQLCSDPSLTSMLSFIIKDKEAINILKNATHMGVSSISRFKNNSYEMDGVLYVNTNKILKFNVIYDTNKSIFYYQLPALNSKWISIDLKNLNKDILKSLSNFMKTTGLTEYINAYVNNGDAYTAMTPSSFFKLSPNYMFSTTNIDLLLNDCIYEMIDDFSNISMYKNEELSFCDKTFKCTKLVAKLDNATLIKLCDTMHYKVTSDDSYKTLLTSLNIDIDKLTLQIDQVKKDLENNTLSSNALLTTWINSNGAIIGNELSIPVSDNSDDNISITSNLYFKKGTTNYLTSIKNIANISLTLYGTDTLVSNSVHNGNISITYGSSAFETINVEYSDIKLANSKHGFMNGKIEFSPSGFSGLLHSKVTLQAEDNYQKIFSSLHVGGKKVLALALGYNSVEYDDFNNPDSVIDITKKDGKKSYFASATISDFRKDIKSNINNTTLYNIFNTYFSNIIPNNQNGVKRDSSYKDDMDKYNINNTAIDINTSEDAILSNKPSSDNNKPNSSANNQSNNSTNKNQSSSNNNNSNDKNTTNNKTATPASDDKKTETVPTMKPEKNTPKPLPKDFVTDNSKDVSVSESTVKKSGETSTAFETSNITYKNIKANLSSFFNKQFGSSPTPDTNTECTNTYHEGDLLVSSYSTTYDYYFNDTCTEYASIIVDLNSDKIAQMSISSPNKNNANATAAKYLELLNQKTSSLDSSLSNAYSSSSNKTFNVGKYNVYAIADKVAGKTYYTVSISVQ